jgi:hypothetical protein
MLTGQALFKGCASEFGTLMAVFRQLGTPATAAWPALPDLPHWNRAIGAYPAWPTRCVARSAGVADALGCASQTHKKK